MARQLCFPNWCTEIFCYIKNSLAFKIPSSEGFWGKFKIFTELKHHCNLLYHLPLEHTGLNQKIAAASILFLIVLAASITPISVNAQDPAKVNISRTLPDGGVAAAGALASVEGTIYTQNGSYQLYVGRSLVAQGKANGLKVNITFTVPELPSATYALTLQDVSINVNATNPFTIQTGYQIIASPTAIQEGSIVTINAAVTGGQLGISYFATVAIVSPSGAASTTTISLGTPNVQGTARGSVVFPSSNFQNGVTDYTGAYTLTFNQSLAQGQFFVNILDSTTYHRGQTMNIKATGYQSNQAVTLTIASSSQTVDTKSVSTDANGVINAIWEVSSKIPLGELTLKIVTAEGTPKSPADQQTFTIIGYTVVVQVTNLAGKGVPGLLVKVNDASTNISSTGVADAEGYVSYKLERGSYTVAAYLDDVVVGSTDVTVTGDGDFVLRCQLTDMKITVKTVEGTFMPFVDLDITFNFQSGTLQRNGNLSAQTDPSGSFTLASTVVGATYTIDASIYNHVFNVHNDTVTNLPSQGASEVTILCPSQNVSLTVTGYDQHAIPGARIEFVELLTGLFYSTSTDASGQAATPVAFGNYRVRIFKDNSQISQETLQVFKSTQEQIRCTLYGIQLHVSVVDFFGSPIANAKVTLNGPAAASASTKTDGVASFENIIGGNMQITAQVTGEPDASQVVNVNVNEPSTVQVKMAKYVLFGGVLVEASTLVTILLILVIAVLFIAVEVVRYRLKVRDANKV